MKFIPLPEDKREAWRASLLLLVDWIVEDLIANPEVANEPVDVDLIRDARRVEPSLFPLGVLVTLADLEECMPVVELRINQAVRRTGLDSLLVPALDDMKRMVKDIVDARMQVRSALDRLME